MAATVTTVTCVTPAVGVAATAATYAAESRPKGGRGFWRLHGVHPTASAAWDALLGDPALAGLDLRVRALRRPARTEATAAVPGPTGAT